MCGKECSSVVGSVVVRWRVQQCGRERGSVAESAAVW